MFEAELKSDYITNMLLETATQNVYFQLFKWQFAETLPQAVTVQS